MGKKLVAFVIAMFVAGLLAGAVVGYFEAAADTETKSIIGGADGPTSIFLAGKLGGN